MSFWTDGVVPWNSLDDNTRAPLTSEIEAGYPCGEADQELFNWTAGFPIGQIWNAILASGLTPDRQKLLTLAKAIQSQGSNKASAASWSTNSLAVTIPVATAVTAGLIVRATFTGANPSDDPTLNVNATGGVAIKWPDGSSVLAGGLAAGTYEFFYTGALWLVLSGLQAASIAEVVSGVRTDRFLTPASLKTALETAEYTLSSDQTITAAVFTAVAFSVGSNPSFGTLSGGVFTFSRGGTYVINSQAIVQGAVTAASSLGLVLNTQELASNTATGSANMGISCSAIARVSAGDTFYARTFRTSGTSYLDQILTGPPDSKTRLCISRIGN